MVKFTFYELNPQVIYDVFCSSTSGRIFKYNSSDDKFQSSCLWPNLTRALKIITSYNKMSQVQKNHTFQQTHTLSFWKQKNVSLKTTNSSITHVTFVSSIHYPLLQLLCAFSSRGLDPWWSLICFSYTWCYKPGIISFVVVWTTF